MHQITLKATKRDRLGSRYAQRYRREGLLPAVLYGHGAEPLAITLDDREAVRHIKQGEKVFSLTLDGESDQVALLKDIQFDYLGDTIVHIDLARVDLDEMVEVSVPVRLVGEAVGLKSAGAVLAHPVVELELRCRVTSIPEHYEVDVSNLGVDESIHVRDLPPQEGLEILTDEDAVLATIHVKAEEASAEAAAVEGSAAEPEVIRERKPAEDEKGKDKDK